MSEMSKMEKVLERLLDALYDSNAVPSRNCKRTARIVLTRYLLPLLEDGQSMRNIAWNCSDSSNVREWDTTLEKLLEG